MQNNRNIYSDTLKTSDPDLHSLMNKELERQRNSLELIASENFTSKAVLECLGSILTNKYSEGVPFKRYYGGNQHIDEIELLCIERAKKAYRLDGDLWGVNVQPYSGSPANLAVYIGLLEPGDKIMGLDLPSGGHLTHGYQTEKKKISAASIYYTSKPYKVDESGFIDYEMLENEVLEFKPKLLICGASAYSRDIDYARFRKIADSVGAYLMCDMAHTSGLIAAGILNDPFQHCDIVTTTTHKSLRGPRAGMIFFRKKYETQINQAVFPSLQGGPHNNQIAAIATQLHQVCSEEFKKYAEQVVKNAKYLAECLMQYGYKITTNGTDNHLMLLDLRPIGITGSKVEKLCDELNISLNKNSVPGDISALSPGGIRIGTPALTSRGLLESDCKKVAEYVHKSIQLALKIQNQSGSKKLEEFSKSFTNYKNDIILLKSEIVEFISQFPFY